MSSQNPERLVYSHVAELARAFGHEHRLKLLDLMSQGEWSLDELAKRSGISVANASQHLQTLRRVGVVTARRAGKNGGSSDITVRLALPRTISWRSSTTSSH